MIGTLFLAELNCADCFQHFAVDQELLNRLQQTGKTFYCPLGHGNVYRDNELARLKKENQRLKTDLTWQERIAKNAREDAENAKRQKAAIKGQLTKTRRRIANGVCPCCNRMFVNVTRHMVSKHPDFKEVVS